MKSLLNLNPLSILPYLIITTALGCGKTGTAGDKAGSGGLASSAGGATTCPAGNERCPCYGNNTCNGRLQCFSNLCVDTTSSTGGAAASGGAIAIGGSPNTGGAAATGGGLATGGSYAAGGTTGGANSTGGASTTGGTTSATGGKATGGVPATGGAKATGGSPPIISCNSLTVPTATGNLSVTGGYVTVGTLKGYAFTYIATVLNDGAVPNSTTCITPACNTNGCTPMFGSTALCTSGVVTADASYNTVAGIGFNMNQDSSGATNGTVAAPAYVTVTTKLGSGAGDAKVRIVFADDSGTKYCAESGQWTSGTPIPIPTFNTQCWDPTQPGTVFLAPGARIQTILLEVPSSAEADRPFSMCLTAVTFSG